MILSADGSALRWRPTRAPFVAQQRHPAPEFPSASALCVHNHGLGGWIRLITGVKLRDYGCALRVFRQDVAKNLELYGELHRFIPVLAVMQGASNVQVPVRHHPRVHGRSKYGMSRTFKVISDLLLLVFFKRYKDRPIHLFGTLGILTFVAGAVIDLYFLIIKILGHDIWGKPLLLLGFMLTIGGIQIITIGIISEMIMRTYYESQDKKPYRIKRIARSED